MPVLLRIDLDIGKRAVDSISKTTNKPFPFGLSEVIDSYTF